MPTPMAPNTGRMKTSTDPAAEQRADAQMATRGWCLCKNTRWEFDGEVSWACYCHCDDCRRQCAAPVTAWLGVPMQNFRWTGTAPKTVNSSEGVYRHFCAACGTPMALEAHHYAGGMHLYAASMEHPEDFSPAFHVNYQSKLPWLQMEDDLPKYKGRLVDTRDDLTDYSE